MNSRQREYFRQKLLAWRAEIVSELKATLQTLQTDVPQCAEELEKASQVGALALELRAKDRCRKLLQKIDEALRRIERGTYGYCLETGEPIPLRRLEARPIALLSAEAQARHEQIERLYRSD